VSLDYLVGKTSQEFDKATLKRIEDVSKLPDDVKAQIFQVMDALIRDYKANRLTHKKREHILMLSLH
jgi:hypothetical protein